MSARRLTLSEDVVAFDRVMLDANILMRPQETDVFLDMADAGLIQVKWSEQVIAEARRNVGKGMDPQVRAEKVAGFDRRIAMMREAYPDAMLPDPGEVPESVDARGFDKSVLATAEQGQCSAIATFNEKDFLPKAREGIGRSGYFKLPDHPAIVTPQAFIGAQMYFNRDAFVNAMDAALAQRDYPPHNTAELIDKLATRNEYPHLHAATAGVAPAKGITSPAPGDLGSTGRPGQTKGPRQHVIGD